MRIGRFCFLAGALIAAALVSDGSLLAQDPGRGVTIKGKRYWADAAAGAIRRSNLDGSGAEDVVAGLDAPYGLALDPIAGVLLWTNSGGDGAVQRWNPSTGELVTLQSEFEEPYAIVLDDGKVRTAYAVLNGDVVKATEDHGSESDRIEILVPGEPEPLPLSASRSILEVGAAEEPEDPVPRHRRADVLDDLRDLAVRLAHGDGPHRRAAHHHALQDCLAADVVRQGAGTQPRREPPAFSSRFWKRSTRPPASISFCLPV